MVAADLLFCLPDEPLVYELLLVGDLQVQAADQIFDLLGFLILETVNGLPPVLAFEFEGLLDVLLEFFEFGLEVCL